MSSRPPSEPTSTAPVPSEASTTEPAQTLEQRITTAGIDCDGRPLDGEVDCTYDGEQVTITTAAFANSEQLRQQACDAGYVNANYEVAVGDEMWLAPDNNTTTKALAKKLGLTAQPYCP